MNTKIRISRIEIRINISILPASNVYSPAEKCCQLSHEVRNQGGKGIPPLTMFRPPLFSICGRDWTRSSNKEHKRDVAIEIKAYSAAIFILYPCYCCVANKDPDFL